MDIDKNTGEACFLLELLKFTCGAESAQLRDNLLKAHREAGCILRVARHAAHVALLCGFAFYFTAFSLPHLSEVVRDFLAQLFFLVAVSSVFCSICFAGCWCYAWMQINRLHHTCRSLLKGHFESRLLEVEILQLPPGRAAQPMLETSMVKKTAA